MFQEKKKIRKTVAIIGAGVSGLGTAKAMFEAGLSPTLFDVRTRLGGLWSPPSANNENENKIETLELNRKMTLTTSTHANAFSDWYIWNEEQALNLNVGTPFEGVSNTIDSYARNFLSKECPVPSLGTKVVKISPEDEENIGRTKWRVLAENLATKHRRLEVFDFVVVATGREGVPYIPYEHTLPRFIGKKIHSSQYTGQEIFPEVGESASPGGPKKRKIVIVGGGVSGVQVAADIALRASSQPKDIRENIEIIHMFKKGFWIAPRILPVKDEQDPDRSKMVPLDFVVQSLEPMDQVGGPWKELSPMEQNNCRNKNLRNFLGGDQTNLGNEYRIDGEMVKNPIPIAISESYANFVRTGVIKPCVGVYQGIGTDGSIKTLVSFLKGDPPNLWVIPNVDTIVFATGYSPFPTLQNLFGDDMSAKLEFQNSKQGVLKSKLYNGVILPELRCRTLGFVGIVPYDNWNSLELQGKLLASFFSGQLQLPKPDQMLKLMSSEEYTNCDSCDSVLRIAKDMNIDPFTAASSTARRFHNKLRPIIPAHTFSCSIATLPAHIGDPKAANQMLDKILNDASRRSANVSRAIFNQLHGEWTVEAKQGKNESAIFKGRAHFHPRLATFTPVESSVGVGAVGFNAIPIDPKTSASVFSLGGDIPEYVYTSQIYTDPNTEKAKTTTTRMIYRFSNDNKIGITVWKCNATDNNETAREYNHLLDFDVSGPDKPPTGWIAKDTEMDIAYRFMFSGSNLNTFYIRFGQPTSETRRLLTYTRVSKPVYKDFSGEKLKE